MQLCLKRIQGTQAVVAHFEWNTATLYPKVDENKPLWFSYFIMLPYNINVSRKYLLLVGREIHFQLNHTLQGEKKSLLNICLVTFLRQRRSADTPLNVSGKVLLKFCFMFLNRKMNYSVCPCYYCPWQSMGNCLFVRTSRRWDILNVKQ